MAFAALADVIREAAAVAQGFQKAGYQLYLVGGIVRDLYLDRTLDDDLDLDLTTDAVPTATKAIVGPLANAVWDQGERFGTIGARVGERHFEITTFRSESYDPNSRKPDVAFSTAVEADLSRRDFTVNAMAIELPTERLVDPYGGRDDLETGVLRTPLRPEMSFADDPLRMMRAARFSAGYDLTPTEETVAAMTSMAERLDIVSRERIRDELVKLLCLPAPSPGLELLANAGLLERFLPEADTRALTHIDAANRDDIVRLAVLLCSADAETAAARARALRYSKEDTARLTQVIAAARAAEATSDAVALAGLRRWVHRYGDVARAVGDVLKVLDPQRAAAVEQWVADVGEDVVTLDVPLTGDQVMAAAGVPPGPVVGDLLQHLQTHIYEHGPVSAGEAEALVREWSALATDP